MDMTQKEIYEDLDVVLNSYGHVDVELYYQKGRAMQAEALKELFSTVSKGIGSGLHGLYEKYLCPKCSAAH